MANKQYYKYVITLDAPMWPRKIVDDLSYAPGLFDHLVSVTDLQNDGHIYGDTYHVRDAAEQRVTPDRRLQLVSAGGASPDVA